MFIFALNFYFLTNQTDPKAKRKRKTPGKCRGSDWRTFELNAGKEEERASHGASKTEQSVMLLGLKKLGVSIASKSASFQSDFVL